MGNSNKPRPIPGRPVPGPVPGPAPCGQFAQPNPYAAQHYGSVPGCPVYFLNMFN